MVFQKSRPGQLAAGTTKRQPAQRSQRHCQRIAADHAIAHIELYKPDEFRRGGVEFLQRVRVAVPVEHQVRRQNAPARDGSDVRHGGQDVRLAQETDHAEVKEGGAEAAPGERESDALHKRPRFGD